MAITITAIPMPGINVRLYFLWCSLGGVAIRCWIGGWACTEIGAAAGAGE